MDEPSGKGLSRRDLIRTAAVGSGIAAVAGTGLAGGSEPAPDLETPPPPIPAERITETVTADVVVAGAGTAGLLAAFAAARAGAKVVVVEKMATLQGRGGDNAALNSKLHRQLGIVIDKNQVIDALMRRGEGRLDQTLLNLWADHSGPVMDLIIDLCAEEGLPSFLVIPDRGDDRCAVIDKWPLPTGFPADWDYTKERYVEFPACHRPGFRAENQRGWLRLVEKKAAALGARFHYETRAAQLLREGEKGRVTGLVAQRKDGGYTRFTAARGVILCTGDYGFNREMMARYCPQMPLPCMVRTSMGEGHLMAIWVGAVMENPPHAPMSHMFHVMGTDAFLQVNRHGKRFYNEDSDTESMANQAYEQGGVWVVFDARWPEHASRMGPGFKRVFLVDDRVREELEALANGASSGPWSRKVLRADTLEQLAAKMEVPAPAFLATIQRYNQLAKEGKDLDFGKRPDRLTPVSTPPFYAEWTAKPAFSLVVMGGLLVNERLQAVDRDGDGIPGLYLAGNTVGRRFKSGYPLICPGISHGMALTHGFLAGRFAAEQRG
jgi:fumarate reductase flavoprotein subunit